MYTCMLTKGVIFSSFFLYNHCAKKEGRGRYAHKKNNLVYSLEDSEACTA